MPQIIDAGIDRNLTNLVEGRDLKVNSELHKFVTFINEVGGVHTVVVAADHPAQTAEELLAWFLNTKGAVESGKFDGDKQGVLDHADNVVANGHPFEQEQARPQQGSQGGVG